MEDAIAASTTTPDTGTYYLDSLIAPLAPFLAQDNVTDILINRPGEFLFAQPPESHAIPDDAVRFQAGLDLQDLEVVEGGHVALHLEAEVTELLGELLPGHAVFLGEIVDALLGHSEVWTVG